MPEGKLFNCPSCGSSLSAQGSAAEIKCPYCGNTVIVPEELRAPMPIAEAVGVSPEASRWIKWSIWGFVIFMVLTVVLPLVCGLCGGFAGIVAAFAPFFVK